MPASSIPAFLVYCLVSGITPGPANLASLSCALRYGRDAALRQWRGLFCGFAIDAMIAVAVNRFLGGMLGDAARYLSWVGAAYILWLAWHVARSSITDDGDDGFEPSFRTGLTIQLTNAKALLFCITALSSYVLPHTHELAPLLAAGAFLPFTGPMCNLVWLFAGVRLRNLLQRHQRVVNLIMAASLIACAIGLVIPR